MTWMSMLLGILALAAVGCSTESNIGENDDGGVADAQLPVGAYDECGNGMDDDGDGQIDEDCYCGRGETQSCFSGAYPNRAIGVCADGLQRCEASGSTEYGRWGVCESDTLPGEELCDGLDNDCDGATDEDCPCIEGETRTCGEEFMNGPCMSGAQSCRADGTWSSCEGAVGPSAEVCDDQIDNDCDGAADEGCGCLPEPETCGDGIDNDCDGEADEGCACSPEACGTRCGRVSDGCGSMLECGQCLDCTAEPALLTNLGDRIATGMARDGDLLYIATQVPGGVETWIERLDLRDMSRTELHSHDSVIRASFTKIDVVGGRLCALFSGGSDIVCGPTDGPYVNLVHGTFALIGDIAVDGEGVLWLDNQIGGWALRRTEGTETTEVFYSRTGDAKEIARDESGTVHVLVQGTLSSDNTQDYVVEVDLATGEAVERMRSTAIAPTGDCVIGTSLSNLTLVGDSFATVERPGGSYGAIGGGSFLDCPFDFGSTIRAPGVLLLQTPERRDVSWLLATDENIYSWAPILSPGDFDAVVDFALFRMPASGGNEEVLRRWVPADRIAPTRSSSPVQIGGCALVPISRHVGEAGPGSSGIANGELWTFGIQ